MSRARKPFRDGRVHICRRMCDTCIFRAGNLMHLDPGRRDSMVQQALKRQSWIICHETLDGKRAVCRGFYNRHATVPLQIAARMEVITWQEV